MLRLGRVRARWASCATRRIVRQPRERVETAEGTLGAARRVDDDERERSTGMYQNTDDFVDLDFEQKVRQTAYHLWENDGRPAGREKDYWFKAIELEMAARHPGDTPPEPAND